MSRRETGAKGATIAGLLRRLLAIFYDSLLLVAVMFVLSVPLVVLNGGEPIPPNSGWYRLYLLAIGVSYFTFFWLKGGQTLGMKSWRLRVVTDDGLPLTPRRALLRCLGAVLSWLPLAAGYLWVLIDRDGLAWHDRLSHTRLVVLEK